MRVLTLNLWGRGGDWPARRRVLREGLRSLAPDLVCFQESIETADYQQAADLLEPGYLILEQHGRHPDGTGITIASRWPIERSAEVDLHVTPRTGDFPCSALLAEVTAPGPLGSIVLVNHLPDWELEFEYEREQQAVVAARAIESFAPPGAHVIVAGDLDADPQSTSIRFWTGRTSIEGLSVCYRDAWESIHEGEPGHTFTPRNALVASPDWPFRRIDYIFVRCGRHTGSTLEIVDCRLAFDQPDAGVWATDHFGLIADLRSR